jgi:hypothetical protein
MRVIFSIILNGKHHLLHNDQYKFILDNCDKWVVVEGASRSNGSTRWCKSFPEEYHNNGGSVDGTREFLEKLSLENSKLVYVPSNGFWNSKDDMVNRAIEEIKKITDKCFLWEFDIDEQWTSDAMNQAEKELVEQNFKYGAFRSRYYLGKNLIAKGHWGEGRDGGYIRLWNWSGESFVRHEPPTLEGCEVEDGTTLTPVFDHYAYYFEEDVKFKDLWYSGHEQIYDRWKYINQLPREVFPIHISALITGYWGTTDTGIFWNE